MLTLGLNLPAASFATYNYSLDVSIHNLLGDFVERDHRAHFLPMG